MKRILMIAYHFPPLTGSSGIQRTLRFVRYLPEFGWSPIVLTAASRAYEHSSQDQLADIPAGVEVIRAPAWDSSRHFAIAGRYPAFLARPDRWISWYYGSQWFGRRALSRHAPDAIWSTYPIATAHLIGASLARASGLPWVADFRDPMAQPGYPADARTWRAFDRIERQTVEQASLCTFTTPGAARTYGERYPERAHALHVIENGFDEETFQTANSSGPLNPGYLTLLHSGIVYPDDRDPSQLFSALRTLREQGPSLCSRIMIRFRASGHSSWLHELAKRYRLENAIEILPALGYRDALEEMRKADGLLVLQASECNDQIPAKFYEYLRAQRPILVLSDRCGDTAGVARAAGIQSIAPLDDANAIMQVLQAFAAHDFAPMLASPAAVRSASRRERTRAFSGLLDGLVACRSGSVAGRS